MLHKNNFQETSWRYPASNKIIIPNYAEQPIAYNKTIDQDNVLARFNQLTSDNTTYENKNGLPSYGVVNANPMKTVYKFGNDTLETKTHPTYGNNIYSTNHNKYIKQYSDMEYSRLKDPIQRKVKEEQLKDKFSMLPIEATEEILTCKQDDNTIIKNFRQQNETEDINTESSLYDAKRDIDELKPNEYGKKTFTSADLYRLDYNINPTSKIIKRNNKRFQNIDNDYNNNLPTYMQNKNVIDIKDQKYKINETDQDKHTNKLLKNSKNELLQDKYAIDENINPLNTSKKDKNDKLNINKHKARDNITFEENRKENFEKFAEVNEKETFNNEQKQHMINDNESRNLLYMSMKNMPMNTNVNFDYETRDETFYNNISKHKQKNDFMDKFNINYDEYEDNETFAPPRSNYVMAENTDIEINDNLLDNENPAIINKGNSKYYKTEYALNDTSAATDEKTLYEFRNINKNNCLIEHIPINYDYEDEIEQQRQANKKNINYNEQRELKENNKLTKQQIKKMEAAKIYSSVWDRITAPFKPNYNNKEPFTNDGTNLSTALETYIITLQAQAKAIIEFVTHHSDFKPWEEYWGYLTSNINKCNNLFEILDKDATDVAYVQNKGVHMRFRVRDKKSFVPLSIYTYVLVHEMAHLANGKEWGHGYQFQKLMHLLEVAAFELNIIQPEKYPRYEYKSDNVPILTKDSIKHEIKEGIEVLIMEGKNRKYYENLLNCVMSK